MRSYAEMEIFSTKEWASWSLATHFVGKIPDEDSSGMLRCHEIARALGKILNLDVQDGWFGMVEHSWLWTSKPEWVEGKLYPWHWPNILDVYAVGSLPQVQLIDCRSMLPYNQAFRPCPEPRTDIRDDVVEALLRGSVPRSK